MRVVIVGPAARRSRLRRELPERLEVVGEADTLAEARRLGDVDGYLVAAAPAHQDETGPGANDQP